MVDLLNTAHHEIGHALVVAYWGGRAVVQVFDNGGGVIHYEGLTDLEVELMLLGGIMGEFLYRRRLGLVSDEDFGPVGLLRFIDSDEHGGEEDLSNLKRSVRRHGPRKDDHLRWCKAWIAVNAFDVFFQDPYLQAFEDKAVLLASCKALTLTADGNGSMEFRPDKTHISDDRAAK